MSLSYACHDHIVLLLEAEEFENPPAWLTENFNIIEGGTHTGGTSKNKLIVFEDGTYLELFTFVKEPTSFRTWYGKPAGLIDTALTTMRPFNAAENFKHVSRRVVEEQGDGGLGVAYKPPKKGGRKRKDGKDVEWEVSDPLFSDAKNTPEKKYFPTSRMDVPFFCHDITPRIVRVPFDEDDIIKHPCGASGVAAVDMLVPPDKLTVYADLYASILGVAPQQITGSSKKGVSFALTSPITQAGGPVMRVRIPTSDADEKWIIERGVGIREIELFAINRKDENQGPLSATGIGATVSLVKPS